MSTTKRERVPPTARRARGSPRGATLLAASAVLIALALFADLIGQRYAAVVSVTVAAAITATTLRGRFALASTGSWPTIVLGVGTGLSLLLHVPFAVSVAGDRRLNAFAPLLVMTAALVLSFARHTGTRFAVARFYLALVCATALLAVVLEASPVPVIDVWRFQQRAAEAMLDGWNPYSLMYPNLDGPGTPIYAPEVLREGGTVVAANPYPPLSLLVGIPAFVIANDVRWALLFCMVASSWMIRRLGGATPAADLAALFMLLQPVSFFVLEQAWTEPIILSTTTLAGVAVMAARKRPDAAVNGWVLPAAAGALALGSKQYAPILVLPVLLAAPARHALIIGLAFAGAAGIAAPWFISDPEGFWRSVVEFQLQQPYRSDAMSWLPLLAAWAGRRIPVWPAFAVALVILAVAVRPRAPLHQVFAAGATAWLFLVLFNKQAFTNYYWVAVGLLCAAVAAATSEQNERAGSSAAEGG